MKNQIHVLLFLIPVSFCSFAYSQENPNTHKSSKSNVSGVASNTSNAMHPSYGISISNTGEPGITDSVKFVYVYKEDTIEGKVPESNNFNGQVVQLKKCYNRRNNLMGKDGNPIDYYVNYIRHDVMYWGSYKNGKKTGTWHYPKSLRIYTYGHTTTYMEDTVVVKSNLSDFKKIVYIGDSNYTYGYVYTNRLDKVNFECFNKSICKFYPIGMEEPIIESDFEDLEMTLFQFERGLYEREMKFLYKKSSGERADIINNVKE